MDKFVSVCKMSECGATIKLSGKRRNGVACIPKWTLDNVHGAAYFVGMFLLNRCAQQVAGALVSLFDDRLSSLSNISPASDAPQA